LAKPWAGKTANKATTIKQNTNFIDFIFFPSSRCLIRKLIAGWAA
jgi:hypothetical protein